MAEAGYFLSLFYSNHFILPASQPHFGAVVNGGPPMSGGMQGGKMVMCYRLPLLHNTAFQNRLRIAEISAAEIQRHRIERSEHPHVRDNGPVSYTHLDFDFFHTHRILSVPPAHCAGPIFCEAIVWLPETSAPSGAPFRLSIAHKM